MGKKTNKAPDKIEISPKEEKALRERITKNQLTDSDIQLFLNLLSLLRWIQGQLSKAKLTIRRLKKLFGFTSESNPKPNKDDNDDTNDQDGTGEPSKGLLSTENNKNLPSKKPPQWDDEQNHGRLSADDYPGCAIIEVPLDDETLKSGLCPHCLECDTKAKLTKELPTVLVFLESSPLVTGDRYHLEKVKCSVCQTYFTAPLPKEVLGRSKYSDGVKSSIAIHHYYGGLPFKRLEKLQESQGVPLADSTQYDLMVELYEGPVKPLIEALRQCAANGEHFHFDDTPGRIIEQIIRNKQAHSSKDKNAIHATALLSEYQGHRIYLFETNQKTAGKVFSSLLQERDVDEDFKTMSDASASNFAAVDETLMAHWIIALCLAHSRRKFYELFDHNVDDDVNFVIRTIGTVYHHERHCKQMNLSQQERLEYHQKHSKPLMEALRIWLTNLLRYNTVEPNSRFGQAIIYLLKRWVWLTQFYRVLGIAMDNNICEIAIKIVICYRNNSLFYATFYGAQLGDAMMSLLHTAAASGINLFDYFTTIQQYAINVEANPHAWLPWCYQQTVLELQQHSHTVLPAINDSS